MGYCLVLCNTRALRGSSIVAKLNESSGPGRCTPRDLRCVALDELRDVREPPERVIAVGGDGTVNAAVSWLVARGWDCPIAIVPAGTGNNLASGLGLPFSPRAALELALRGQRTRVVDGFAYEADDDPAVRYVVQTSALGYPAEMAGWYDYLRRRAVLKTLIRPLGSAVYRLIGISGLVREKIRERLGRKPLEVIADLPGERLELAVSAIFLANERSLGGDFIPCPRARFDDGLADLCLVRARAGVPYLKLFRSISRGEHLAFEQAVVYRQTPGPLELRLSSPSPFLVDGDIWTCADRYRVEVRPALFRIVCG